MNEQWIAQNMSTLVFNNLNRGMDKASAIKDAKETMQQILESSKNLYDEMSSNDGSASATNS